MTTAEQARKVAEFLGWRPTDESEALLAWQRPDGLLTTADPPDFANDLNAIATVEAEIKRRGWEHEYVTALRIPTMNRLYGGFSTADVFRLMHATAAQRLAACVAVIEQMEGSTNAK